MLSRPGLEVGANNQSPLKGLTSQLTLRLQSFSKDFAPLAPTSSPGRLDAAINTFQTSSKGFYGIAVAQSAAKITRLPDPMMS